jgi:cellulose synthase operon protein B
MSVPQRLRTFATAAALAALVAAPAAAQLATPTAVGEHAASAPPPASIAASSLHRLGADMLQLRFEGETSTKVWPVYVTAAQAQTRARVHIAYTNAISVMPEASSLSVSVNDVAVAQASIAAASDPGNVDVELPRGLLEPGFNAVRVSVEQRHRVDCSLEATYELWTQLDPAQSGLAFPGLADQPITSLDDLAALSPDSSGAVPIRAILQKNADPATIDLTMRAIQAVALRGGYVRPAVDVSPELGESPGLAVAVGTRSELRDRGLGQFVSSGASLTLTGAGAPGRSIVVVTGANPAEIAASIEQILPPRRAEQRLATPAGARALTGVGGYRVTGDMRISFHDLGVRTQEFNGRLFRSGFDIVMPPDFYPADYDKLTLLIDAGYSPGLDPRSQILVRVNDREAASLQLRNPNGDLFRARQVTVSLSALRPGFNHVVVEAQVPQQADKACDVHALLDAKKRFVLIDRSELVVPGIARIVRMPNLSITAASGFPYANQDAAHLYLPRPGPDTIGAAATFLARAAIVARRPLHTAFTAQKNDLSTGSAILVGAIADFRDPLVDWFGLDCARLKEGWSHPQEAPKQEEKTEAEKQMIKVEAPPDDLFDQWADNVHSTRWSFDPTPLLRVWYDRYINVHSADFAFYRSTDRKFEPDAKATIVVSQTQAPSGGHDTWTIVAAANDEILARDMRNLVAPTMWNRIEGRAIAFDPKKHSVVTASGNGGYFIETATLTPANFRLVAAGWLSSNVDVYVLVLTLAALALGVLTKATVRLYGART